MIGKTLGQYEIIEPLGKGGMGEVYRARDTTLERIVAIKVLPDDLVADADRLARLDREAKLLASLNHPNIATIHNLQEVDGSRFLVLELIEGESLEQVLDRGAMPPDEALRVCKQVAEALEVAHGEGIIHRDLKPANILVTPDGRAKVLDFGIAKTMAVEDATAEIPAAQGLTATGMIVGTPPYMSPEQLRGGIVDRRADVWAFGCLFFELLTGKGPFTCETMADTFVAILEQEPDWNAIPETVPPEVHNLIQRCLRKDPRRRLRDTGDAWVTLDEIEQPAFTTAPGIRTEVTGTMPEVAEVPDGAGTRRGTAVALVAGAVLGAAALFVAMQTMSSAPAEPQVTRFDVSYPPEHPWRQVGSKGVAISRDGSRMIFSGGDQLWQRAMGEIEAIPIHGTEGGTAPFFSPDGEAFGFWDREGGLWTAAINGGAPSLRATLTERAYGAYWAEDGYIYAGAGAGGILRIAENGGEPQTIVELADGEFAASPQLLPGSETLLFSVSTEDMDWNGASIALQPVSGGERTVIAAGTDGRYLASGHLMYARRQTLFAVPFDSGSLAVGGDEVAVVEGLRIPAYYSGASQFAVSDGGSLVYRPQHVVQGVFQLAWLDRTGRTENLPFDSGRLGRFDLSPDGQRLALSFYGEDRQWDVWIYELGRAGSRVLLAGDGNNHGPMWSPDGQWIYFSSDRGGNLDIWRQPADRSSDAELVLDLDVNAQPTSISPDGRSLLFVRGPYAEHDIGMLALDGDTDPEMLLTTDAIEHDAKFSPDGRFFAYATDETGQMELQAREIATGRTFPISTAERGGVRPTWSKDGSRIYYDSWTLPGIMVVDVERTPFSVSAPLHVSDVERQSLSNFEVTDDEQQFLVALRVFTSPEARLHVVLNWFEELEQRVPSGR